MLRQLQIYYVSVA